MANKANTKIIFVKAEDRFSSLFLLIPLFQLDGSLSFFHSAIHSFIHSISHEHMKMEMSTEKYQIQNKYEADAYQYTQVILRKVSKEI